MLVFTLYPLAPDDLDLVPQLVADHAAQVRRDGNFTRAFSDDQFWVSLMFSLKYTLLITPILMVGGYLLALLTVAELAAPARDPDGRSSSRSSSASGVSSLLWYWLFSPTFGLDQPVLLDLGLIDEPVLWLGVDADRSTWAIIGSVTWKVIGFGMILFVGGHPGHPARDQRGDRWSTARAPGSGSPG